MEMSVICKRQKKI